MEQNVQKSIVEFISTLNDEGKEVLIEESLALLKTKADLEKKFQDERRESFKKEIFERCGITPEKMEGFKKAHARGVYWLTFKGRLFIYASPTRVEYNSITKEMQNLSREEAEALVASKFVVFAESPEIDGKEVKFTLEQIASDSAGIPSILSDEIMDSCGFAPDFASQKL